MSHDAHAAVHPATSTGIPDRKLAIWTFIGSECLFFASLISVYLVYKGKSLVGPLPHTESQCMLHGKMQTCEHIFEIPLVTTGTAVLLFSSFFIVLAPLMPRPPAICLSSGSSLPLRPPPLARRAPDSGLSEGTSGVEGVLTADSDT